MTAVEGLYLVIVRKEANSWVVDEDSYHILEAVDDGKDYPVELGIQTIRSLAPISPSLNDKS